MKIILNKILGLIKKTKVKIFLYIFFPLILIFSIYLIAFGYDYDYGSPWNFFPFSPNNFSKANYEVTINAPATQVDNLRTCYTSAPDPEFYWRYEIGVNEGGSRGGHNLIGPGQAQTGFWIQIDDNQNFSSVNYSSGWMGASDWSEEIAGTAQGFSWNPIPGTFTKVAPAGNPFEYSYKTNVLDYTTSLSFNTNYYWRILVGDGDSNTGCIVNPAPAFPYPNAPLGISCPPVNSEFSLYATNGTDPLTATFTTLPYCPPTNLRFTAFGNTCTDSSPDYWTINLEWDQTNTDETGFEVWTSADGLGFPPAPNWSPVNLSLGVDSTSQALSFYPGTTKYYTVKVKSAVGDSDFISPISTTSPSACNPKINPITAFNCDTIAINWVADGNIASYDVYRTVTNSPYGDIGETLVADDIVGNSYFDNNIVSGNVTYSYRVEGTAVSGEILPSYNTEIKDAPCQNLPFWKEGR